MEEPANHPIEELADQPIGHPANPSIAPVDDVYYPMDDPMRTSPSDFQAIAVVANWDSN